MVCCISVIISTHAELSVHVAFKIQILRPHGIEQRNVWSSDHGHCGGLLLLLSVMSHESGTPLCFALVVSLALLLPMTILVHD